MSRAIMAVAVSFFVTVAVADTKSMALGLLRAPPTGIVVDVGANGGGETTLALNDKRRVVAIECLSDAYVHLRNMFSSTHNVTVVHICAGGSTGLRQLHLAMDSSSLIAANVAGGPEKRKAGRTWKDSRRQHETVVIVPLDDLIDERVALLKIDVQGYEYEVIRGATKLINRYLPVIVYEFYPQFHPRPVVLPKVYECSRVGIDQVCTVGKQRKHNK